MHHKDNQYTGSESDGARSLQGTAEQPAQRQDLHHKTAERASAKHQEKWKWRHQNAVREDSELPPRPV